VSVCLCVHVLSCSCVVLRVVVRLGVCCLAVGVPGAWEYLVGEIVDFLSHDGRGKGGLAGNDKKRKQVTDKVIPGVDCKWDPHVRVRRRDGVLELDAPIGIGVQHRQAVTARAEQMHLAVDLQVVPDQLADDLLGAFQPWTEDFLDREWSERPSSTTHGRGGSSSTTHGRGGRSRVGGRPGLGPSLGHPWVILLPIRELLREAGDVLLGVQRHVPGAPLVPHRFGHPLPLNDSNPFNFEITII